MNSRQTNRETILCAAWVAPMDQPPLRDGAVVIRDDRIAAVGAIGEIRSRFGGAEVIDLPGMILTPGLINAHTHLELTNIRCAAPPRGGFVQWIESLMKQAPAEAQLGESIAGAIEEGVRQCLHFGVTTVGDISRQSQLTRPLLRESPLRVVSFGEIQGMAQRRGLIDGRVATALAGDETKRFHIGISPHAPYSVEPNGYQKCLAAAKARALPLTTHLAENSFEKDFLNAHAGPFRELWAWLNAWDEQVPIFAGSPVQFAKSVGLLDYPALLAHVNYCDDEDLKILSEGKASVVWCPRTHRFFQHPPHRWREMIDAGINVAVGTDSCASSPDLNLLDDLRVMREIAPQISGMGLWEMVTIRAARGLMLEAEIGSITAGKYADIVAFAPQGSDPLLGVLDQNLRPSRVWIEGRVVGG